jgi:16S rRNA (adenine1518-N6/adenine1519-N6)-dimethyltransferase
VGQRLGQHFLNWKAALEGISEAVCPGPEPLVVEIGAGRGALTAFLLKRAERVIAIETDPKLAGYLAERFPDAANLTIVHADVLKTDLGQWGPPVVAGNLPYYITSPILRHTLALGEMLRRALFLVQKEVADRLTAQPGSRSYGFLTVQTALAARAEVVFPVPAAAFRPVPKVDSALVRLTPHPSLEPDPEGFLEFVSMCFRQKRKTLRNNLTGYFDKRLLDGLPEAALRAEKLTVAEFQTLYRRLKPKS